MANIDNYRFFRGKFAFCGAGRVNPLTLIPKPEFGRKTHGILDVQRISDADEEKPEMESSCDRKKVKQWKAVIL